MNRKRKPHMDQIIRTVEDELKLEENLMQHTEKIPAQDEIQTHVHYSFYSYWIGK